MNNKIKTSLLNTCTENKNNFNKTCILKKSLLFKSHKFTKNSSSVFNSPKKLFKENKNDQELNEEKNKKIFLPFISSEHSSIISTKNTESKDSYRSKSKYIKIKKLSIKKIDRAQSQTKYPVKSDINLMKIYNENFEKKKRLELFKETTNNLDNFSFRDYNINLLKLSSINLSKSNFKIFKRNMNTIHCAMNGIRLKRYNKWLSFLEKIEDIAPESLRKKIISFSRDKIGELF
jgi:hypothetical protein